MNTPLTNEDLSAVAKIVRGQLNELRDTRDKLKADGLMSGSLGVAINTECDRLNMLESRVNDAMEISG
jgi:signal transduction histidine kinase